MKIQLLLFLCLSSVFCNGQAILDCKNDSLVTFFEKGMSYKNITHDKSYKISIKELQKIILQTFEVDIFHLQKVLYYMEIQRGKQEVYPKDCRYIYVIRFAILAEEELANKIYHMDAQTGKILYKDEYGTQEDFFNRAKDLPKEKIDIPLRNYNRFKPL